MSQEKPTLRCAVYAAVSSGAQAQDDKVSIAVQLRQARDVAARFGATVISELVVPGQSRSIDLWEDAQREIPAFAELGQLLKARSIDVLIFLNWSRLARTESLGAAIRALCRRAGVQLYDLSSPPREFGVAEYNQGRSIVDAVLTIGAQAEVEELVRRHREGMIGRVRAGRMPSGQAPWGYVKRYDTDGAERVEIDQEIAPWVRSIFQWYLDGASGITIADRLRAAGQTRPTGVQWDFWFVYKVLDLAWRYAGYSEVNRHTRTGREYVKARGNWPAIIDEDTAQRTVEERAARKQDRGLADTAYALSGVVYCATCGGRMRIQHWKREGRIQLICEDGKHPGRTIPYARAMRALRAAIQALADVDLGDIQDDDPSPAIEQELVQQSKVYQTLVDARDRANSLYVMGHIDIEAYVSMVAGLDTKILTARAELDALDAKLQEEVAQGTRSVRVQEVIEDGLVRLDAGDVASNAWLRRHVRIWIRDNKVEFVDFL